MIKKGQTVTLNWLERSICGMAASMRKAGNSKDADKQISKQDPWEMDMEAFGAELAFCKMANLYPDFNDIPGTHDCVGKHGIKIDVKFTKYDTGKLLCRIGSNSQADIYVLMTGTFPTYTYRGFATHKKLHSSIVNLSGVDTYGLSQDELD